MAKWEKDVLIHKKDLEVADGMHTFLVAEELNRKRMQGANGQFLEMEMQGFKMWEVAYLHSWEDG